MEHKVSTAEKYYSEVEKIDSSIEAVRLVQSEITGG
jgi:hypothetical protein